MVSDMPAWAPVIPLFAGAALIAFFLFMYGDRPDWRSDSQRIAMRALFMVAMAVGLGIFLILSDR
jgi:hypothetical protein